MGARMFVFLLKQGALGPREVRDAVVRADVRGVRSDWMLHDPRGVEERRNGVLGERSYGAWPHGGGFRRPDRGPGRHGARPGAGHGSPP